MDVLKSFPEDSFDCVMTSPPYWALRDYGEATKSIWDARMGCEHEWGNTIPYSKYDGRSPEEKKYQGATVGNSIRSENFAKGDSGQLCALCGAWRGQLGLEPSFDLYIKHLCDIFDEVKRTLKPSGTCWVNIGDTYYGSGSGTQYEPDINKSKEVYVAPYNSMKIKQRNKDAPYKSKSLVLIPFRFALEMVNRGWILRNTLIWQKPSCMPSSASDRFTVDFEYLFFSRRGRSIFLNNNLNRMNKL